MPMVLEVFVAVYMWPTIALLTVGTGAYFASRIVRAIDRRNVMHADLVELRERVRHAEQALEEAQREIRRLHDGQEFTTRLLSPREQEPARSTR